MFGSNQSFDHEEFEADAYQDATGKRSRKSFGTASSRSRRTIARKRTGQKRSSGTAITGMAHRRQRKWSW